MTKPPKFPVKDKHVTLNDKNPKTVSQKVEQL